MFNWVIKIFFDYKKVLKFKLVNYKEFVEFSRRFVMVNIEDNDELKGD